MAPAKKPEQLRVRFEGSDRGSCTIRLLWEEAPKTCEAIVKMLDASGSMRVKALHGRNSGAEALFLTPQYCSLGDENTTLEYKVGDFLFGAEPKGICQHASEDASEVAWCYGEAVQPRRWISVDGDPTNQRGPFKTTDVPLNKWAVVVGDAEAFYAASAALPRSGARSLVVERVPASDAVDKMDDAFYYNVALEEAKLGMAEGGIPIGACLVDGDGKILGRGRNQRVQCGSVIHHGEMNCLENAGRLPASVYETCTLYTTLSPCQMCAGAVSLYKIPRLVIGENTHFQASETQLRCQGVAVNVIDHAETKAMFKKWATANPNLWSEDIGEDPKDGEPPAKKSRT